MPCCSIIAIGCRRAAAVFFAGARVLASMRTRRNLVHARCQLRPRRALPRGKELAALPRARCSRRCIAQAARLMLRVNPRTSRRVRLGKLMAAGMRKTSPMTFIASKGIMARGRLRLRPDPRRSCACRGRRSSGLVGLGAARLHGAERLSRRPRPAPPDGGRRGAAGRTRPALGQRRGRARLRRRGAEADGAHGGSAHRGVRARTRRDAHR